MSRVAIKESVLRWAIDRAGIEPDDLRHKFPKIEQWISGENMPTLRQIESLAKATLTPLGYFFLAAPPEEHLPIPYFRTRNDALPRRSIPELFETIQMIQRRQAWMREYLMQQGQEPLAFVRSALQEDPPILVANRIRHTLGLAEGWASREPTWTDALRTLREAMEDAGILIVVSGIFGNNTHRKLDPEEFRGFVLVDEYAPFVFVNGSDGKAAQMFTLAHEMAHVFLGSSAAFDLREMQPADDPTEQACNQVAAEFLISERELLQAWPSVQNELKPFHAIARQFKVSTLVAARRALDLRIIQREDFFDFYEAYKSEERLLVAHKPEGGDFYATQNLRVGRRFASAVIRAAKEGKLLYSEAYQLTGLYGKTFEHYADSLKIGVHR